jgi:hypothetical protein
MDEKQSIAAENEEEPLDFKEPRDLHLEFRRMIGHEKGEIHDTRAARNAIILRFGRANAIECPDSTCHRQWICQRPAYQCHLAHYADLYNWDYGNPNCPRQAMYDEIKRRWQKGEYDPSDCATDLAQVVRAFQPDIDKKRRFWTPVKQKDK